MQELKKTREVMPEFTKQLMTQIDKSAENASNGIKDLESHTMPYGRPLVYEIQNEIHKTRFCIQDFSYIYDISEDNFYEPKYRRLNLEACLIEIKNASSSDLFKTQIEAKVHVKPDTPKFIPVEENLFITIATNIFRQLMIMTSRNG